MQAFTVTCHRTQRALGQGDPSARPAALDKGSQPFAQITFYATSATVDLARWAMVRWIAGGISRSSVVTMYQLGLVRQAGSVTCPAAASTPRGTSESAMNAARPVRPSGDLRAPTSSTWCPEAAPYSPTGCAAPTTTQCLDAGRHRPAAARRYVR